jgi:hypothetical protein
MHQHGDASADRPGPLAGWGLPRICAVVESCIAPVPVMSPSAKTFPATEQLKAPRLSVAPVFTVSDLAEQLVVTAGMLLGTAGITTSSAVVGTTCGFQLVATLQLVLVAPVQRHGFTRTSVESVHDCGTPEVEMASVTV